VPVIARDPASGVAPLPSISGLGASWTEVDSGDHEVRAIMYVGTVATAGNTVTLTWSGGVSPKISASDQEWANLTNIIEAGSSNAGTSTSINALVQSTNPNDLVIAVGGKQYSDTVNSPGTPWIQLNGTSGVVPTSNPVYQIVSSSGTFNPSWSWANSADDAAAIVAIKGTGSNLTPTPTPTATSTPGRKGKATPTPTLTPAARSSATPSPTPTSSPTPSPTPAPGYACANYATIPSAIGLHTSTLPVTPPALVSPVTIQPGAVFGGNTVHGDGSTDDTAPFQAALNSNDVCIQAGHTYIINGTLNVPPNRNIQCQNPTTTIILNPLKTGSNMTFAFGWSQPSSNDSLVGCQIAGTDTAVPAQYSVTNEYNYLTLISDYAAGYPSSVDSNILIEGNIYRNGWTDMILTYAGSNSPTSGPNNVTIAANKIYGGAFHGWHLNGGQNLLVEYNVSDAVDNEPEIDPGTSQVMTGTITHEYFTNSVGPTEGNALSYGYMTGCGTDDYSSIYSGLSITNNTIDGLGVSGSARILLGGTSGGCSATFSGNTCINGAAGC
jgi:hypothetical protein